MAGARGIIIHPEELDETWVDRLLDARINTLGLHPVGGSAAPVSMEGAIERKNLPETRRILRRLRHSGITVEYEAHAMSWLLPRSLFPSVPAFFRMDENGNRVNDINLCPGNEEALEYIADRAEMLARLLETGSDRYFFWMDDVRAGRCFCPACRKLSASDQQLRVVNAMLQGIRRYKASAKLCYLAYFETIHVPSRIEPADGVFLEYAPFERDHHAPMFAPQSEANAKEIASVDRLLDFFGKKGSQVLEYWMDNSKFSGWKKPPRKMELDEEVMRQDVRDYREHGFENITSFGCFLGGDYRALYGEPPVKAYGDILNQA